MWFRKREDTTLADDAVLALGLLGMAFMGYLSYLHFKTTPGSSFCNFGAHFSCEIVNKSVYAELFGVPLAFMGLAYFGAVAALAVSAAPWRHRAILLFSVFSLVFSLRLSFLEFFVLGAICLFCEASKLVMLAIIGLTARSIVRAKDRLPLGGIAAALLAGLVFTAAARYFQAG
ncbi:MAG TPA: vitamin K epoxide reductase family protein [Candidatus Eisenbacteria bacterium]|nr:vitamin K epoxide reductase family protein [Candidatus Eisenbacteria bacterium]